jgi:cell division protein FtsQ
MDARGSWSLVLGDGTQVMIGRTDARVRLARFARMLPQLMTQYPGVPLRADLRYTNGFALEKPGFDKTAFANPELPITNHGFST